jgi:glycosyltransferase involved in cell wall biosynthesis
MHIVPISRWTKEKAEKSELISKFPMTVIHNGLDVNIFKPFEQKAAREFWDLPADKKIILFGAAGTYNPLKGFDILLEALKLIDSNNLFLCTFGSEQTVGNIYNAGMINNSRLLAVLYSAADLFIMPSLAETFGQVTIESLACGTPVVSFPNGGSKDIILNGFNGILTDDFIADSLAKAMESALNISFNRDKSKEDIKKRFNLDDQADQYISLYQFLLQSK